MHALKRPYLNKSAAAAASAGADPLKDFFEGAFEMEIEQDIQSAPGESRVQSWLKHTGYEVPQKYFIRSRGMEAGSIAERMEGWIPYSLRRAYLGGRRPSHLTVENSLGEPVLRLFRPFSLLASTMFVRDSQGQLLGIAREKFAIVRSLYELFAADSGGAGPAGSGPAGPHQGLTGQKPFGFINASGLPRRFPVKSPGSRAVIGEIRKKWGGAVKEAMTNVDAFTIRWNSRLSLNQKAVLFSTAISIDYDCFERF